MYSVLRGDVLDYGSLPSVLPSAPTIEILSLPLYVPFASESLGLGNLSCRWRLSVLAEVSRLLGLQSALPPSSIHSTVQLLVSAVDSEAPLLRLSPSSWALLAFFAPASVVHWIFPQEIP